MLRSRIMFSSGIFVKLCLTHNIVFSGNVLVSIFSEFSISRCIGARYICTGGMTFLNARCS